MPKHILINENERDELLKKYGITLNNLPRIISNDPAIKELNAKPGDVIKIVRTSMTAGESIYYRVVSKG